jgi:drug/metabolite transporter, DME family
VNRSALLVLTAAVLWGTTGTAQALGPAAASPVAVGTVRVVLGGGLLTLLALRSRMGRPRRVTARQATAAILSAATVAAYQPAFFAGVERAGVALGTIVTIGSAPAITGILARLLGSRPPRGWGAATLLATTGCALLVAAPGEQRLDPLGLGFALAAGASYAVYTVGAKYLLDVGWGPGVVMGVAFGGGALLAAPLLLGLDLAWLGGPRGLAAAAWLSLATMGIAYTLFGRGLAGLAPSSVATLSLAEPLTATTLGVVVLGERLGAAGLAGAGLVLAGLMVLARAGMPCAGGGGGVKPPPARASGSTP